MEAYRHCKSGQQRWAMTSGLELSGSKGTRGELAYTALLNENLFQSLVGDSLREFEAGDGDELKVDGGPPKMHAVHSSAALTVNLFDYWRGQNDRDPLAQALGLSAASMASIEFEIKRPIMGNPNRHIFKKDPNLDVVITIAAPSAVQEVAVECKFTEPYRLSEPEKKGLARAYLREEHLWTELPNCLQLAQQLCPRDNQFIHLHAAQLIKHMLGLKHRNGKTGFKLLYLWFDVPDSPQANRHRDEINDFRKVVEKDGLQFLSITVQEVIRRMAAYRDGHERYVDYVAERYL